ncbi:hypothetical protein BCV71DRAFT_233661 [Rhizopus microsporus]|uniref:Uncharacterized protein n=1 Tax=Rhizopus microsporus TaxID=58291 RepID=A0A1X0S6L5_RHIZD|nr:hypothetical protein BCV71DRAFT_233661 [Rhizopus microsporus]
MKVFGGDCTEVLETFLNNLSSSARSFCDTGRFYIASSYSELLSFSVQAEIFRSALAREQRQLFWIFSLLCDKQRLMIERIQSIFALSFKLLVYPPVLSLLFALSSLFTTDFKWKSEEHVVIFGNAYS